jgi:hypothetical protein
MDYRKFLGRREELVLPYFGALRLDAPGRKLRLAERPERGFWRFDITGRNALALVRVPAPTLDEFPRLRGHFASGYLFEGGREARRVEFLDADPPAELTPSTARSLPGDYVLFEGVEFESEAEDAARRALEEERNIAEVAHVGASLRAAFAYALLARVGRRLNVPCTPGELGGRALNLANGGGEAARALLQALQEQRRLEQLRLAAHAAVAGQPRAQRQSLDERSVLDRASDALERAGATLLDARPSEGRLDVTWRFLGERVLSLVEPDTLRIIDAGFCLQGEDDRVTLESLPSVLKEAIDSDLLHITRW